MESAAKHDGKMLYVAFERNSYISYPKRERFRSWKHMADFSSHLLYRSTQFLTENNKGTFPNIQGKF